MPFTALLLAVAPALAVADPMVETVTPGNTLTAPPIEWLGETPHLVIMGTVNGYPFDIQYLDLAAADVHAIEVKREYAVDGDKRPYIEFDFALQVVMDGVAKNIEGKLNHADFLTLALPATLALGTVENPAGANTFTEFEFEWEKDGVSVNEEVGDWGGTAVVTLDSAFEAADPTGEGRVGGFIDARNGDNVLAISFTFDVDEVEVEAE
jgi:hypothetical protein